jgi:NADH:ubiquinone oxidoreductase subunit 6 (subunit J)
VVKNTTDVEFGLTVAVLFITMILLLLAAYWTRKESFAGMMVIILVYFCALAYFLFKLVRMYAANPKRIEDYKPARKSLTTFSVITILLVLATIIVACMCTHNFNKGLKPHLRRRKPGAAAESGKPYNTEMPHLGGSAPNRMTID